MFDMKISFCEKCNKKTIQVVQEGERGMFVNCQECGTLTDSKNVVEGKPEFKSSCSNAKE